jgi:hypothetical protein
LLLFLDPSAFHLLFHLPFYYVLTHVLLARYLKLTCQLFQTYLPDISNLLVS